MKHLTSFLLILLLSSCSTVTHTSSPARAYASTTVRQTGAGSFHIVGDWDYVDFSMVRVQNTRVVAIGGFEARVARGKCLYSYYVYEQTDVINVGALGGFMDLENRRMKHLDFTRGRLDEAARGEGLTVRLTEKHNQQFFSAAYLRGFLQKVDEAIRKSSSQPAAPPAPPQRKRAPNPATIALSAAPPMRIAQG